MQKWRLIWIARANGTRRSINIAVGHQQPWESAATPGFDVLYWDITDELARLALTPSSDIVVTFVPNTGRQHARVTAANAASTVTVGNVRIQQAQ